MQRIALAMAASLILAIGSSDGFAHGKMVKSEPADGEVVKVGLTSIKLNFKDEMQLTVVKIIDGNSGLEVKALDALDDGPTKSYSVQVPALEAGIYKVNWIGVASDGHIMNEKFEFTVRDVTPSEAK